MRQERYIPLDPEQAGRLVELRRRRENLTARLQRDPNVQTELDGVLLDIEDAEQEVRDNSIKFVALSIGKTRWKELKAKYPPTKEQKREAQREGIGMPFDVDTFPQAAFRECLHIAETDDDGHEVLMPVTDDMILRMFDENAGEWNDAEIGDLTQACIFANGTQHEVGDLGNG